MEVRLGALAEDGIAASVFPLVERGCRLRPQLAAQLQDEVELRFEEGYVPVRIAFGEAEVLVEDASAVDPAVVLSGRLPDVVLLTAVPLARGVPRPTSARGRRALSHLARGRVRLEGSRVVGRRLLALLSVC